MHVLYRVGRWLVVSMVGLGGILAAHGEPVRLNVVTSIRPLALIVADIAPPGVHVDTLVPANADPHSFQLKPSDMARVAHADLVVWLGEAFERFLVRVIVREPAQAVLTVSELSGIDWASEGIKHQAEGTHEDQDHGHGQYDHDHTAELDPHIWLNPENAKVIARAVAARLSERLPEDAQYIQQQLNRWLTEVDAETIAARRRLAPLRARGFGVVHDGYTHFVKTFGLTQLAAVSVLPTDRLSARKLTQIQRDLAAAYCLVAEAETPQTKRLATTLNLPWVVADPLATSVKLSTYTQWFAELTSAFVACLSEVDAP